MLVNIRNEVSDIPVFQGKHKGFSDDFKGNRSWLIHLNSLQVGLSPSQTTCVICFIESPLKKMENAFYFIWKALFVLKIFKFLSWPFGHEGKTAWLKR